jgi:hypothetical protein
MAELLILLCSMHKKSCSLDKLLTELSGLEVAHCTF